MKYLYCKYDTHEKEKTCTFYEEGKKEKLGCYCKFMEDDQCYCIERIVPE